MIYFLHIQASIENDDESDSSGDDYHDAMDDESMYHTTRDTGDEVCLFLISTDIITCPIIFRNFLEI